MEVDKFRLIEEVRKRPNLWDCQSTPSYRNTKNTHALWDEIGKVLNIKSHMCKYYWQQLRIQFCHEVRLIRKRIEKAKSKGEYDPNKKYYTWMYFDALTFSGQGRASTAHLAFMQHSDVEVDKQGQSRYTRHQLDKNIGNNSIQTESDSDIEIVEQNSPDNLQYREGNDVQYESDNEFIAITNLNETHQNEAITENENSAVKNMEDVQENMALRTSIPNLSHSSDDPSSISDIDHLDKFRLIEEVRRRPDLWIYNPLGRNKKKFKALFDEVGRVLKVESSKCKDIWQRLRAQFWGEVKRIKKKIETAKSNGEYDPNKIYYSWVYFDALRFLASSDLPFMKKCDIETDKNSKIVSEVFPDDNSLQTESENDMEIIENENYYDRDNDMEFIDTTSLDEQQSQIENRCNPHFKKQLELVENAFEEKEYIIDVEDSNALNHSSNNPNSSYIADTNQIDKFRLIEEVRKRPFLWDCQTTSCDKNHKKCTALWDEIGEVLKVKSTTCMHHWQQLCIRFRDEVVRIESRIVEHDTNEEYHTWIYFDALMFLAHGRVSKEHYDLTFMKNKSIEIEKSSKIDSTQHKPDLSLNSGTESETETDVDKLKCRKRKYFENYCESDSDMEFIDNNSLDKPESQIENEKNRLQDRTALNYESELQIQIEKYPVESSNITVDENEIKSSCLDNPNTLPVSDINQLDQFRLIEEVRKRPGLWDDKGNSLKKDQSKFTELWAEVGIALNANAITCVHLLEKLRVQKKCDLNFMSMSSAENQSRTNYERDGDIEFIDSSLDETQSQIGNENSTVVNNRLNLNIQSKKNSVANENFKPLEDNEAPSNSSLISNTKQLDKFRLIEEVRKRPALWTRQTVTYKNRIYEELWSDIGKVLKAKANTCKRLWQTLRIQFCNEVQRVDQRVREAKENGNYDPNKKYYTWVYLEPLIFAERKDTLTVKYDLGILKSYVEMDINNRTYNTEIQSKDLIDSNVCQTENDSDIEIMECGSSEKLKTRKRKSRGYYYEGDTDIDVIDNDKSKEIQPQIENESNTPQDDTVGEIEAEFQTEMENCPVKNVAEVPENNSPTLSIPAEIHSPDNSDIFPTSNECEFLDQVTFSRENNISANDQDCSFLYSFLLPTKVMNQLQKMEFHANMERLLEHILPGSSTVNTLENDLLLPDENDPDMKFLMSFLPFIKSMSLIQSLQFRSNMSDLVYQILSTDANV